MAAAAVLVLGAAAAPAAAAPPQFLGQNPIATKGGCTLCSAFQLGDSGSNPYEAPSDGVLTRVSFYVGPVVEASDYVQARTFRRTGGSNATVISEGEKHSIFGLSEGLHTYFERIPIAAGDVLGGRFETTPTSTGPHISSKPLPRRTRPWNRPFPVRISAAPSPPPRFPTAAST